MDENEHQKAYQVLSIKFGLRFVPTQLILDSERDRYLLISWRWQNEKRDYGCPIHVDIKDNKIWIQQDFTESGIARQLLDLGVPKSDIVLGFRSPYVRQFSEFSVS